MRKEVIMYTHNYEKLTYNEAKGIIDGTFTQESEIFMD